MIEALIASIEQKNAELDRLEFLLAQTAAVEAERDAVLEADGVAGATTRRAIERYERDRGLPARGVLSPSSPDGFQANRALRSSEGPTPMEQDPADTSDQGGEGRNATDRLRGITAFLPRFQAPGFEFGRWEAGKGNTFGYWSYSDTALEFHDAIYRCGWTRTDFDWGRWLGTPEGKTLREDPLALVHASPDQLAKLLTLVCAASGSVKARFSKPTSPGSWCAS